MVRLDIVVIDADMVLEPVLDALAVASGGWGETLDNRVNPIEILSQDPPITAVTLRPAPVVGAGRYHISILKYFPPVVSVLCPM